MPDPKIEVGPEFRAPAPLPDFATLGIRVAHGLVPKRLDDCLRALDAAANGDLMVRNAAYTRCFGEITRIRVDRVFERYTRMKDHFNTNTITYRTVNVQVERVAFVNSPKGPTETWDNVVHLGPGFFLAPQDGPGRSQVSVIIHELSHGVKDQFLMTTSDHIDTTISDGTCTITAGTDVDIEQIALIAARNPEETMDLADSFELFACLAPAALAASFVSTMFGGGAKAEPLPSTRPSKFDFDPGN